MGKICLTHNTALEYWRRFYPFAKSEGVHLLGSSSSDRHAGFPAKTLAVSQIEPFSPTDVKIAQSHSKLKSFDSHPVEILVTRPDRHKGVKGIKLHSFQSSLPKRSVYSDSHYLNVVSPELLFVQLAETLDAVDLALLGCEFCGFYAERPDVSQGMLSRLPLTSKARIAKFCEQAKGMRGSQEATRALRMLIDGAASPREAVVFLLLCAPRSEGGYGLPHPIMNGVVRLSARAAKSFGATSYVADLLWPSQKVIVEYDGAEYHSGSDRISRDAGRRDALIAEGYTVFVLSNSQLVNCDVFDGIARAVAGKLGVRLRIRMRDFEARRAALRRRLLG